MALLTGVQHLCIFSIYATLSPFPNFWKALYTISASIFYVAYWPPHSRNKFISCVVRVPRSGSFTWRRDSNHMDSGENDETWWYRTTLFFMPMEVISPLLSRTSCTADNERFLNIHHTHPIWVNAIMISSPKWKNHCEGSCTTKGMKLPVQ